MKKLSLFFIATLLFLGGCKSTFGGAEEAKKVFRETHWGMTMEEVMATTDTTMELIENKGSINTDVPMKFNNNILWYKGTLNDENVLVQYVFYKDRLVEAAYEVDYDYNRSLLGAEKVVDYQANIIEKLNAKYGVPTKDDGLVLSPYGKNIEWEDEETRIFYYSSLDNDLFTETNTISIYYFSKEYEKQKEKDENNTESEL